MKEVVFETFSEPGFERVRFSGRAAEPMGAALNEVLPLLVRLSDKGTLTVDRIPAVQLQKIVDTAAGGPVELSWEERGSVLATASLAKRSLALSTKRPCGLRDLLFFACLQRVHTLLADAEPLSLQQTFELAWELIVDELPQALEYCTQATDAEAGYGYAPRKAGTSQRKGRS